MIASQHNIICLMLTKSLFDEFVVEGNNDYNVHLVSPNGNIFLVGDTDEIDEIEIDKIHTEYVLTDAGDTVRKILFHGENSDYSILVNEYGVPNNSTGITSASTDTDEFKEFVEWETGKKGQEVTECENNDD